MTQKHRKRDVLTVSQARAQLFDLIDAVTRDPGAPVVIVHRDRHAVLVDEGRFRTLERLANDAAAGGGEPFRLFGSMRLDVPEDEFDAWLEHSRRTHAERAVRKLEDL